MAVCGHSFCSDCLEIKMQTVTEQQRGNRLFKCPQPDCEREIILPASIENFSLNRNLEDMIENEKLIYKERFCLKHSELSHLFCMDCKREICTQCLSDHERHKCQAKNKAIEFFVEKCKEKEKAVLEKSAAISEKQKQLDNLCIEQANIMISNLENTLLLFNWTESIKREQEIFCVSRMLMELEFLSHGRKILKLEKEKQGYQYVKEIVGPIIRNPGKNVMEPFLVLELAEHTLKITEQTLKSDQVQIQLIRPLTDSVPIAKEFLRSLQKSFQFEYYSQYLNSLPSTFSILR